MNQQWTKSVILFIQAACLISIGLQGQTPVYLQLERANTTKVKRFYSGDKIFFKTMDLPDQWQQGRIFQVLPRENALVFDDRITYLEDITDFKYYRTWPRSISFVMTRFGAGWLLFGGVIEGGRAAGVLDTQYKFGWDTAFIGVGSVLTGILINRLWSVSKKKMNDRNRLRIIDIRP